MPAAMPMPTSASSRASSSSKACGERRPPLLVPGWRRTAFEDPDDEIGRRRRASELPEPRRVLRPVVLAVQTDLMHRLQHVDRTLRIREPGHAEGLLEPALRLPREELGELAVVGAHVPAERLHRAVALEQRRLPGRSLPD